MQDRFKRPPPKLLAPVLTVELVIGPERQFGNSGVVRPTLVCVACDSQCVPSKQSDGYYCGSCGNDLSQATVRELCDTYAVYLEAFAELNGKRPGIWQRFKAWFTGRKYI